jgi:uncharacterized protein YaeQ
VALTATMYRFEVDLSDVDRGVYEQFEVRAAQHPSESEEFFVTRLLAYVLEYSESLQFGRGISTTEDATIWQKSGDGRIELWIEVGAPAAERLHRIAKQAERVAIYSHREPNFVRSLWRGQTVHRAEQIEVYFLPQEIVSWLVEKLERKTVLSVSRNDGTVYLTIGSDMREWSVVSERVVTA